MIYQTEDCLADYSQTDGMYVIGEHFQIELSPNDDLLDASILDIEFDGREEFGLKGVTISLSNGSEINIFLTQDGRISIESD